MCVKGLIIYYIESKSPLRHKHLSGNFTETFP